MLFDKSNVLLTVTFSINKRLCKAWKFPSLLACVVIKWDLGAIVVSLSDKTQKKHLEQLAGSFSACSTLLLNGLVEET